MKHHGRLYHFLGCGSFREFLKWYKTLPPKYLGLGECTSSPGIRFVVSLVQWYPHLSPIFGFREFLHMCGFIEVCLPRDRAGF